ncbi:adenosylcobinamide-GDP ribazoletransferase [Agathobaculum sp. NSJ-28]|uniref:Adenosylcobinamide-GDP ribazoletransferase n=2 Tax=Agathobaculum TaxID=2048137 RepID=A0A923RW95_9FIRM|nr:MULTISPECIES: adenosylcobinamide-GDP ribazoletransferase [Agathobaculum]MBC5725743.1 adenosylcobinamide-GDP ribazoletransferase [Agathobaculum faecis]MBS6882475.1 adenosylcobinamide-GDP ribazoletransferase [Clostridiaceae bacterium]MCU6790049.1 adenosylcobinamide-GDP ribazoletransferase [Agathobaculum ammoniilyticum]SCJ48105.1 cobalamin synthase [uncultured Butyricicoccus sp.]
MKSAWSGLLVAFSLYSAVPVPQVRWEKRTMRWALSFLPLVGVLIGVLEGVWHAFCTRYGAAGLFYAVGAALIPLAVSGGIHLDGLCDTCDALCSYGDREKRLAILKDPHVGAFGPLWLTAFLLAETACFAQIYQTPQFLPVVFVGFAVARTDGGRKIVTIPCAKDTGLAHIFAENSDKKAVDMTLKLEEAALEVLLLVWLYCTGNGIFAMHYLVLIGLWYILHSRLTVHVFGGITGDLAGFYISLAELLALVCAAFGGMVL